DYDDDEEGDAEEGEEGEEEEEGVNAAVGVQAAARRSAAHGASPAHEVRAPPPLCIACVRVRACADARTMRASAHSAAMGMHARMCARARARERVQAATTGSMRARSTAQTSNTSAPYHTQPRRRAAAGHSLSNEAEEFLERRRSQWAAAPPSINHARTGLAAALTEEQVASYNRDGRIGIYYVSERRHIIERYMAKRARRAWNKKIRYNCRKNLADRRIRVKGRFVKAEVAASIAMKVRRTPSCHARSTMAAAVRHVRPPSCVCVRVRSRLLCLPPCSPLLQEVSVPGSYVPDVRHEQKVERLLQMKADSATASPQLHGQPNRTDSASGGGGAVSLHLQQALHLLLVAHIGNVGA
ncbi:hypothetical protein EON68_04520, partial [archaeon]